MTAAIELRDLSKTYKGGKRALDGVTLDVPRGSIFGLLGPNGAGKSTTINILSGMVVKTGGNARIWGFDIDEHPRNAKASIGIVPQEILFDPFFTPLETLELVAGLYGVPKRARRSMELLRAVHLEDKANAYSRTLSGGMKRRLLVAKAMVHSPPVLVLDEPTAGVDIELRQQLWSYVRELNAQGVTIVLTTHYLEEAEELCDRIAIINHGRLIADKPTRELVGMAQQKVVELTVDRDLTTPPASPVFEKIELKADRVLTITYSKAKANAGDVITAVNDAGLGIVDVSTREADLEHVFLALTRAGVMQFDVLIVGSGAAGLTAALNLADRFKVGVLAKGGVSDGATGWAQGGIAAVLEPGDTFDHHVEDTIVAGAGLNDRATVEFVVENAPAAIERLVSLGVPFNTDGNALHLTREGGHSHRRIVHVADATGRAIQASLETAARANPNITLVPEMVAIDLITGRHQEHFSTSGRVHGLYAFNRRTRRVDTLTARATILASGGAGRAYLYSTAPRGATGDGIAMAWRAGCRVSNMEFMQFHPTCLYNLEVKNFLITEAVRGEGGQLKLPTTGERFMPRFDAREELAPRDIVARAIDHEIKRLGLDYVHLDMSHKPAEFVREHFPNIYDKLIGLGIDITREPIPVVPAQHYTCGGVLVDRDGCTDAKGLYAAGEVTQSGLHGANRLASNSLLECLVYGEAAAKHIAASWNGFPEPPTVRPWDESRVTDSDEEVVIQQCWREIRQFMWNFVGIVRTTKRLERAKHRIDLLRQEVDDYYGHFRVTADLIELRNLVEVADLIVRSALSRKESRGLHYTTDYPQLLPIAFDTVLTP